MVKQRMRRGENLREADAVVFRGDVLKEDVLRRDATTNFAVYGFYGLSVWVPDGGTLSDDILRGKLVKARVVVRFQAGELRTHGIALWDTGEFPHYDVVYRAGESLDELVAAIVATPSTLLINPYFDPDGGLGPMIYIDLDADLNLEDDTGRNIAVLDKGKQRPQVGRALVAGRPQFWSWAVIDSVEENTDSTATVLFRQVSARHAASIGPLVAELPDAV